MDADDIGLMETVDLLRQVTAEVVTSTDLDQALRRLADLAVERSPVSAWCGISVLRDGEPGLAARSAQFPTALEEGQYRLGEGPCLTAMSEREIVISPDLTAERRWQRWCPLATDHGARAVASYPLDIDAHVTGALNMYFSTDAPLTPSAHLTTLLVAQQASLLLGTVLDRGREQARIERLLAGADRDGSDIDRAVGILMALRGCDQREAFAVLEATAEAVGAEVATVAGKLVSTVATRASSRASRTPAQDGGS
jgi:GAF domain-containing protein